MQIWLEDRDISHSDSHVLTLGTFDGVHRGHDAMLRYVTSLAKEKNSKSLAVTLHPHPRIVLGKSDGLELLTSISERIERFRASGVDILYILRFTKELASTPPDRFVMEHLRGKLGFQTMIVGHDHAFGKDREGDFELLDNLSKKEGFEIERFGAEAIDGEVISSTKIRNALASGDITTANKMLGYRYLLYGRVIEGDKRGRTIGFPTANIQAEEPLKAIPGNGVYAVGAEIRGTQYFGLCNIGVRPTFKKEAMRNVEVHFPVADLQIYGENLSVQFIERIRGEMKFSSGEELVAQIKSDMEEGKNILKGLENSEQFSNFADYID